MRKREVYQKYETYFSEIGILAFKNYIAKNKNIEIQKLQIQDQQIRTFLYQKEIPEKDFCSSIKLHEKLEEFLNWSSMLNQKEAYYPFQYLREIFELDTFECFCIILAALPEWKTDFQSIYGLIGTNQDSYLLTKKIAIESFLMHGIYDFEYRTYFRKDSKLMKYFFRKKEINEVLQLNETLKLAKRVQEFWFQEIIIETEIERYGTFYIPFEQEIEEVIQTYYIDLQEKWKKAEQSKEASILFLYGIEGSGKHTQIKRIAQENKRTIFFLDVDAVLEEFEYNKEIFNKIYFEVLLQQAIFCFEIKDKWVEEKQGIQKLKKLEQEFFLKEKSIIILISDCLQFSLFPLEGYQVFYEKFYTLSIEEREIVWKNKIKGKLLDTNCMKQISEKFEFTPKQIEQTIQIVEKKMEENKQTCITKEQLYQACYKQIKYKLGDKAIKVPLVYQWEDLILPIKQKRVLLDICHHVQYKKQVYIDWGFSKKIAYGTGVSMLFSGQPGTGKTMAAQIIAGQLHMELYKVELATIVSKYIGETEKNLQFIFKEARKSASILFFDEADVLFSKRTEIKESNDKYNNMEAAFLLQKIEEYTGVVVLATNYLQNIDEAFKRRIAYIIEFPFPDVENRIQIWKHIFPKQMPLKKDIDIEFLGEHFELSGSGIKNVVLKAAFYAVAEKEEVSMKHIIKGMKAEFLKSGKQLTKMELGAYHILF